MQSFYLNTQILKKDLIWLETVSSTNTYLLDNLKNLPSGTVVLARNQEFGRGQSGAAHGWHSTSGNNLLCSALFKPKNLSVNNSFKATQAVALAVFDLVNTFFGSNVAIKWPNDVYLNGKKVAGILIESTIFEQRIPTLIIGVGINVNEPSFPEHLPNATSFSIEAKKNFRLTEIVPAFLNILDKYLLLLDERRFAEIESQYLKQMFGLNKQVKFSAAEKSFVGIIKGLKADGRLLIEVEGETKTFGNKQIVFKEIVK